MRHVSFNVSGGSDLLKIEPPSCHMPQAPCLMPRQEKFWKNFWRLAPPSSTALTFALEPKNYDTIPFSIADIFVISLSTWKEN